MLNFPLLERTLAAHGVTLDREALMRLDLYAERLIETNRRFNLTAVTDPDEVTVKHFADSLVLLGKTEFPAGASLLDVGTGAGFPGLALKLARPDLQAAFLDGTRKKLGFISSVLEETGLAGETLHLRAEEAGKLPKYREKFDFVTARAVADMAVLVEYCLPFVRAGGLFLAMKSAAAEEEIQNAAGAVRLLGGKTEQNLLFDLVENTPRRIVFVRKISQTPPKYPRASAKIAKSPLK
ncbi:MAG TPA: 16S rRNA (guanine(527)-N(7))-methyltransferase RsmG [Candidatus Fimenecus stercoravium]|nr:16S rRNA (guanine(527)-N(7))-methyltransferase RsmG [Candidatus Fimenecus stercoravium]